MWQSFFGTIFTAWVCYYGDTVSSLCFVYSDGETFISADDLRINLWNLEISNQSFNIVDVKPANMEDLTGKLFQSDDYLCCAVNFLFLVNIIHANVIRLGRFTVQ